MNWRGNIGLGAKLAAALARIGLDRAQEWSGGALPRTADQIAQSDSINAILSEYGDASIPRVARITLPGVQFESSNCENFLVAVEWDDPRDEAGPLPATLYVKLPCHEIATRAFANAVGFWSVECAFARSVAKNLPIRVPRVYAVAERGARFVLLLENLHEESGTRLFTNRDMAAGTSIDRARLCLDTFAELHAAFWDADEQQQEASIPLSLHPYLSRGGRNVTRALNAAAIAGAHRSAPGIFTGAHVSICRRAIANWDALVDAWYAGPLTLIHGDSHLANCFEYRHDGDVRMGMLDFQGMQWCHGIRDVQYFLINSLEPELLSTHEADLIEYYIDALAGRGVTLDPDEARERYRLYSFQTLMVAVVSLGLGSLTEREETLRTVLARSVAAVDRLGFKQWLDDLGSRNH